MKIFIQHITIFLIIFISSYIKVDGVKCYNCFGTGPTNVNCTNESSCEGEACLIYEAGDNETSTAFCLFSLENVHNIKDGCWLEADGKGKHCLCRSDFCNKLRDRTKIITHDPFASPLSGMDFLKHNPLLDYDEVEINSEHGKMPSSPESDKHKYKTHILSKINGIEEKIDKDIDYFSDDDLVPIDFKDYHEMTQGKHNNQNINNKVLETLEFSTTTTKNPIQKIIEEMDTLKLPVDDDDFPNENEIAVEEDLLGIRLNDSQDRLNKHLTTTTTIKIIDDMSNPLIAHGKIKDDALNISSISKSSILSFIISLICRTKPMIYCKKIDELYSESITIENFDSMDKFTGSFKSVRGTKITNPKILIFPVSNHITDAEERDNDLIGFKFKIENMPDFKAAYTAAYLIKGVVADSKECPMLCDIGQCDIGWLLIDSYKSADRINDLNEGETKIDYSIIIMLESETKRIELYRVPYNVNNIRLSVCPHKGWISKHNIIKFEPEDYIDGVQTDKTSTSHIIVPVYPRKGGDTFFSCGKLQQPTLPDMRIGFKIVYINDQDRHKSSIDVKNSNIEIVCQVGNDLSKYYFFALIRSKDTYYQTNEMIKVEGTQKLSNKFYLNQIFYIYTRHYIDNKLKNSKEGSCFKRLERKAIFIQKECSRPMSSEMTSRDYKVECIGYLEKNRNPNRLNEEKAFRYFFTKAARFVVKKGDTELDTNKQILLDANKLDNYGLYSCHLSQTANDFNEQYITLEEVYILPIDDMEFKYDEKIMDVKKDFPLCLKTHVHIGSLERMKVKVVENKATKGEYDFKDFSQTTDEIKVTENAIHFILFNSGQEINVVCFYKTSIKTNFKTYTKFKTVSTVQQNITESLNKTYSKFEKLFRNPDSDDYTLIFVMAVVFIAFICGVSIVVSVYILKRRRRRRRGRKGKYSSTSSLSEGSTDSGSSSSNLSGSIASTLSRTKQSV
uniref:Ig-like domain-containing protein n=1 Tax=Parastrongyloides trichosuri TaxID=131310 RepID=A0A0N4ZAF9_PARTI